MSRNIHLALYVAAMVVLIVGLDVLLFKDRFWARLVANVLIVAMFGALYLAFARRA